LKRRAALPGAGCEKQIPSINYAFCQVVGVHFITSAVLGLATKLSKKETAMKRLSLIASLVVLSSASSAQVNYTYTLLGDYIFQISGVKTNGWSASSQCTDQNGILHTASGGGSITYTASNYGTGSFDGKGGVIASEIQTSVFDQNASNATVQITWSTDGNCVPTVVNGNAVFDPPVHQVQSGTYSLNVKDGTGTMSVGSGGGATFQATGTYAYCVSGGVTYVVLATLMFQANSGGTPNLLSEVGIFQHGNDTVNPCPAPKP
jgi:hypothetical protein